MRNESRNEKIELLERFAMFLEKSGYTDVDWRTEPPFAIDEFMKLEKLTPPSVDGEFIEALKEAEQVLSKHYASHPVLTKIDNLLKKKP